MNAEHRLLKLGARHSMGSEWKSNFFTIAHGNSKLAPLIFTHQIVSIDGVSGHDDISM